MALATDIFLGANNATTQLAATLPADGTSVTVRPGTATRFGTPPAAGQYIVCTISDRYGSLQEIVHVTAIVGDVLTVVRAQEGTLPLPWATDSYIEQLWTEGQSSLLVQQGQLLGFMAGAPSQPSFSATAFGAKTTATPDTTNDYTAQLQAVIDLAVSTNSQVYFPPGYIYCASTLRNFHSVVKTGPGAVYTGSAAIGTGVFWIANGVVTNNLFVATNGDDTNDGLSAARPMLTAQSPTTAINRYTGSRSWTINFAAGEYVIPASMSFSSLNFTSSIVRYVGVAASTGAQPTVIFKGPDTTTRTIRFLSSTQNTNFTVQNVYFKNMGSIFGASQNGRVSVTNCWCTNSLQMISLGNMGFGSATMGVWDFRDTNGVIVPNSIGAGAVIGSFYNYDQGDIPTNIQLIIQFADRGLVTNECGSGHEDQANITDCNIGQEFTRCFGAANLSGTRYLRCGIGILVRGTGMMLLSNTQNFGTGVDACTQDIVYTDAPTNAQIEDTNYDSRRSWQNRSYSIATTYVPDGAAKTFFGTVGSVVPRRARIGDTIQFFISGRFVGALSANAAINLAIGGVTMLDSNLAFPTGCAEWKITADLMVISNYDPLNPTTAQQIRGIIEITSYDSSQNGLTPKGKRITTKNAISVTATSAFAWTITEDVGGQNFQMGEARMISTIGGFTYP